MLCIFDHAQKARIPNLWSTANWCCITHGWCNHILLVSVAPPPLLTSSPQVEEFSRGGIDNSGIEKFLEDLVSEKNCPLIQIGSEHLIVVKT